MVSSEALGAPQRGATRWTRLVDGIFSAAQALGRLRHDIFAEEIEVGFTDYGRFR